MAVSAKSYSITFTTLFFLLFFFTTLVGSSPRRVKCTAPCTFENRVWSFPIPTFSPAYHFLPLCRIMMAPGFASQSFQIFMPNRRPAESRPLFDDPAAFFVANRNCWCNGVFNAGSRRNWTWMNNMVVPFARGLRVSV